MKIIPQLVLITLTISSSFGYGQSRLDKHEPKKKGLSRNQVIRVSGTSRNYHLFVPNNPINAPIVLLLHGNRGSHNKMLGLKGGKAPYKIWLDIAKRENIIIAVPNGARGSKRHRGWNDCRSDAKTNPKLDDVLFMKSIIDSVVKTYGANPAKVYALGTSNGGHMALRLAQEIPEKLTAFGAIVAANPVNSKCTNADTPISALFMNGTKDSILPYKGGQMASKRGQVHSTENTIAYWVKRNKMNATPVTTMVPDINTSDRSVIEKQSYTNEENDVEVLLYKVKNGGHTEPSKSERYRRFYLSIVGRQNGDIEMAEEIWAFFKSKSK